MQIERLANEGSLSQSPDASSSICWQPLPEGNYLPERSRASSSTGRRGPSCDDARISGASHGHPGGGCKIANPTTVFLALPNLSPAFLVTLNHLGIFWVWGGGPQAPICRCFLDSLWRASLLGLPTLQGMLGVHKCARYRP
jgi:hypothetical protein